MKRKTEITAKTKNLSLALIGHFSFLVLFIFSVYFFRERILFSDTAFQFFKIVNFEKINIEASRYGAILPQIPVLIFMNLGVGLKWLTIIFSASFILLYYLIFIGCTHLLKNAATGLAVVLVLILNISQSFFHPVTETHQSLVFVVLIYAILQYSEFRNSVIQLLLASALIVFTFFIHPIAVYPLLFVVGYVAIHKNQLRSVKPYLLIAVILILAVAKVLFTSESSYEGQFFKQFINSPSMIFELPHLNSTAFFLKKLGSLYFWLGFLEIVLIVLLALQKKYVKLFWQLAVSGFFLLITLLTYSQGDSDMLMERAFMPLALFVAVPLLSEALESNKHWNYKIAILTLIIVLSLNRIYRQGKTFRERTKFNLELLTETAQFPNKKFIVEKSEIDKHIITFWSHSFETLILSTITEDLPAQTIYPASNSEELDKYTAPNSVFLGANFWLEWNIESLNQKYFELPEKAAYKKIEIDQIYKK
jgi:hypothetical protein